MTPETLAEAYGLLSQTNRPQKWAGPISEAMRVHLIDSPLRQAAFLAQVGHESGRLIYVRELWGPTEAQKGYEGRVDLGNTEPGDGFKYRGRGVIQITGRANYAKCGGALSLPLVDHPELLEEPSNAALSAAWFWHLRGLNALADIGDFTAITRRINGGLNGLSDRVALWESCKKALGV